MITKEIKDRLDYLRVEIQEERISFEEIVELNRLCDYVDSEDVELMQWITNKR